MSDPGKSKVKGKDVEMSVEEIRAQTYRKTPVKKDNGEGSSGTCKHEAGLRKIGAMFFDGLDTAAMKLYPTSPGSDTDLIMMKASARHRRGNAKHGQVASTQTTAQNDQFPAGEKAKFTNTDNATKKVEDEAEEADWVVV